MEEIKNLHIKKRQTKSEITSQSDTILFLFFYIYNFMNDFSLTEEFVLLLLKL